MRKLALILIALTACNLELTQPAEGQSATSIGLTRVMTSGSPMSGSGTTANPLDMLLSVTSPITGTGSNGSPLAYGLNATGSYFGDGRDGAINFDGTTTITGTDMSLAPSNCCFAGPPQGKIYTLTRDIHATTIDVQEGVLVYGPYRVLATTSINLHYNSSTTYGGWIGHSGNDAALNVAGGATGQGTLCGAPAGAAGATGVGGTGGASISPRPRGMGANGGDTGAGGAGVSAGGAAGAQGANFLAQNGDIHGTAFEAINMRTARDSTMSLPGGGGSGGGGGGGGGAGRPGGGGGSGGGCMVVASPTITGLRTEADALANCSSAVTCLGVLSVHGGHGGDGTASAGTATGGGGAGQGGILVVINGTGVRPGYEIFGGHGGTATNGGVNGKAGRDGLLIYMNVGAH